MNNFFYKRKLIKTLLFFVLLQGLILLAKAQDSTPYIHLTGDIYRGDTIKAIPFVTIIEKRSKVGTVSNESGHFSMTVRPYDTLLVSAIGFTTYQYVVKESTEKNSYVRIALRPQTYQLDEVGVYAIKNYKEFKKDFINLELPEEKDLSIPKSPMTYSGNTMPTAAISGPFTKLYDKYSKRGKEEKKVASLRIVNDKKQRAQERYNSFFIVKILGVDETEAETVLTHCNFTPEFVNSSNDYDLAQALKNCYVSYKKP